MRRLIAIGASMGGIVAVESVISRLPADTPPIVIVQHILPAFTGPFAKRLDASGPITVVEAANGDALRQGVAYLAPPHHHLLVKSVNGEMRAILSAAPPVRFHRPSVDALFHSLAELESVDIVAALLSGMGSDGADGLLALRRKGARTIAQDESSSLIFGMPKEAIARGAAEQIVSLEELPAAILACLGSWETSRGATRGALAHLVRRRARRA